jgi:preprotein translocase subunit SecE
MRRAMAKQTTAPARPTAASRLIRPDVSRRGPGIGQFLREVLSELRKVVFPTRQELIKLTGLVIGISIAIGLLLGGIDYLFSQLLRIFLG